MDWLRLVQLHFLLVSLMCLLKGTVLTIGLENQGARCIAAERQALLDFKKQIEHARGFLISWTSEDEDCCKWRGVGCDNTTGHVLKLNLPYYDDEGEDSLGGEIGSSLLELRHLSHLDLSNNNFTRIPEFIGSLTELTYLNLSYNPLNGTIPYQLGNLSKLLSLDLRLKDGDEHSIISTDGLEWLSRLSSLESLNMSRTNFTKAKNWLQVIQSHPSLSSLHLFKCYFPEVDPSSVSHINSSNSLKVLHLTSSHLISTTFPLLLCISNNMVELQLFGNNLTGIVVDSFGNMPALQYVNLYDNHFGGGIPKSLGNLCNLTILDLSRNNLSESLSIMLKNLSGCAKNSLEILVLSENQISGSLSDVTIFSKLRALFLQRNQLDGKFPVSFEQFSNLTILRLEENQLIGSLPDLSKLSSLRELYLADNRLNGSFPNGIGQMSDLEILDVSSNSLNGVISEIHLSNLSKLKQLILSFNSLSLNIGSTWTPSFQLDSIQMASCKLGPNFPRWLRTQKNFSYLDISNSEISGVIPSWFWPLPSNLKYLNLSFNNISGQVSELSSDLLSDFHQIDLSSNWFYGSVPQISANTTVLNLRGNNFSGSLSSFCPSSHVSLSYLDLSDNLFSGNLPDCWEWFDELVILNLENNNFSGIIPPSMSHLSELRSLHLRNNNLSGTFPEALSNCTNLKVLDLGENKLSGSISSRIGINLSNLVVLCLRSNRFYGNIPSTICNLESLQVLDLSLNNISGAIPTCLNNLTAMSQNESRNATIRFDIYINYDHHRHPRFLEKNAIGCPAGSSYSSCRSSGVSTNKCSVGSSYSSCRSSGVSTNKCPAGSSYSRCLPSGVSTIDVYFPKTGVSHNDFVSIVWKGMEQKYGNTLGLLMAIDLSSNKLSGEIPEEMTSLIGLRTLNLSRNNLSGSIPGEIGRLENLDSLDLSKNHLSNGIPEGLAYLSTLSVLNLSDNNLSGKIPTGTQLQGFFTSFLGNPELCGDPLKKKCPCGDPLKKKCPCGDPLTKKCHEPAKPPFNENEKEEDEDWFESLGFRIGMGVGFFTGFWGVFGTILLNRSWRHRYFRCLSSIGDWIYLTIAMKISKLQTRLGN